MLYHRSLNRICNNFSQNFFKKTTRYFVSIKWVDSDGIETVTKAKIGDTLLDNAIKNNIELECACEGSLACSTCHVILDENTFESLPAASDKEDDLLDCAFGLTETLGFFEKVATWLPSNNRQRNEKRSSQNSFGHSKHVR
ncbi:hypothetical protein MHBO_000929 [Bonamia ostreae]|uniref:2Fe-2S ferredoxin-type domain-containing protein n=1 Tax=Bonamia ostreae TaxID=126728 RepID=A0ABV2AHA2_9EUKA